MPNFLDYVATSWNAHIEDKPMFVLWKKLLRLQPLMRQLSKPSLGINITLEKAREELRMAHSTLLTDRMNPLHILHVKACTEEVMKWCNMEEQMFQQ
jgi:hypothetical protein